MDDYNSEIIITHFINFPRNDKMIIFGKVKNIIRYFRLTIVKHELNGVRDYASDENRMIIQYDNKIYEIIYYENSNENSILNYENMRNYLVSNFNYVDHDIPVAVYIACIGMASATY
jgi:hypothetical protein